MIEQQDQKSIKICEEALQMVRQCAEHCRDMSNEVENKLCKLALHSVAFCCDSCVKTLETCIELCRKPEASLVENQKQRDFQSTEPTSPPQH